MKSARSAEKRVRVSHDSADWLRIQSGTSLFQPITNRSNATAKANANYLREKRFVVFS